LALERVSVKEAIEMPEKKTCLNLNPNFIKMVIETFFEVHPLTCRSNLVIVVEEKRR